jgi:hypothetical protein
MLLLLLLLLLSAALEIRPAAKLCASASSLVRLWMRRVLRLRLGAAPSAPSLPRAARRRVYAAVPLP